MLASVLLLQKHLQNREVYAERLENVAFYVF